MVKKKNLNAELQANLIDDKMRSRNIWFGEKNNVIFNYIANVDRETFQFGSF